VNAYVIVEPGKLDLALKQLKKQLMLNGTALLMKQQSRLFAYQRQALRRKIKSLRARARARKFDKRQAWYEARWNPE
jgi:ribosomal protein S21